jgi:Phycobilisome degradation protein nblA
MDQTIELTLEQEFSIRNFVDQVQQMSHEQAQEFLILQHKHMIVREMMYQEILKQNWKLDLDSVSL